MNEEFYVGVLDKLVAFLWKIGPVVIEAIVALVVGVFLIRILKKLLKRFMRRANTELSLRSFIESLATFVLYGVLFATIGIIIGIEATSFIAMFGGAAIAVGLALQGSLANFAGGVLILAFKPFRVGDLIEVNNTLGFVQKIDILYTRLKTYDGRMITMPNGNVANSNVDNRTINLTRRVDLTIRVGLDEDIDKVIAIIHKTMSANPAALKEPAPDTFLDGIEEYCLRFTGRAWSDTEEYWPIYWDQLANVKKALDANGIKIAIPKREIVYAPTPPQESKG
jgi:small conductance mechanosensitive channel